MDDERSKEFTDPGEGSGPRELSLLEAFDLLVASIPPENRHRRELYIMRSQIAAQEETIGEAQQMIEKLEEVIKKVTSPANRIGTYLSNPARDTAHIVVGGADYYCNVDPRISLAKLKKGTRVLVNEAYVIVGDLGFETAGPVTKITEVIGDDRLRVGSEHGLQSLILQRSAELMKATLKSGDEVRVDPNYRVALEVLSHPQSREHYLDVPELPWEKVGGQDQALQAIKDAIELPLIPRRAFRKISARDAERLFALRPARLRQDAHRQGDGLQSDEAAPGKNGRGDEGILHARQRPGNPEHVGGRIGADRARNLFDRARKTARRLSAVFLFIDEAESILGTRRASRYSNILSTLVPMFCSEMDGIDSLHDVVIILASNRADLIDPAILRPGRIDRKIKVNRPNKDGAREIYRIYLTNDLPYDGALAKEAGNIGAAIDRLVERILEVQFARRDENKFLEITLRSGRKEILYRSDLLSGAIIASIVERAKAMAIKRTIANSGGGIAGISESDLQQAFVAEFTENDIFPPTDMTEDWFKLIDYDPENVVKISPVRRGWPGEIADSRGGDLM